MTRLPRLLHSDSGTAAAEMALILPMVFALLFGGFEAGNYMLTEHKVIKGVRDGARYAARQSQSYYDECGGTLDEPDSDSGLPPSVDVIDDIKAVTRTGQITGGPTRVSGWSDSDISVVVACDGAFASGLYRDVGTAPHVTVITSVSYPSILGQLGFDTAGVVVRAQANAAVMGL